MKKVYFNHDGGVDDLISLFLLIHMEDIDLIGVSAIGADSYIEPATSASQKIVNRFSKTPIHIAASKERGKNPFPKDWRMHAFFMDALPILNEQVPQQSQLLADSAYEDIIEKVNMSKEKVTLLFTGPLTDLAKAITVDPKIVHNIERLVWMGGTFLEKGNVEEPEHDGTAEWNAFWDPEAVKTVFDTEMKIDMVALESTNQVPMTWDIRQMWANERHYTGVDFLGVSYAAVPPLTHFQTNSTYFLWDVLTTAYVGKPNLVKQYDVKASVYTEGPSQGRTYIDEQNGRLLSVVNHVEHNDFFNYITKLAKKVK
ncbi:MULTISPECIES: nucleoside hydrolase [Staphylococcus]|jgi:purine nucleosidase|uniref:nucleoside hydrolase n=1 Tax=Staphylococcus TaxID=1279 RepID=UPI000BC31B47|nr:MULTISPECIES: nucleoside hydrolase [Staphylococcus]ATH59101.1 purine nucleosidase [Staphylococcus nepalensis]ATH64193.1 purine nucleosidase [Staphylococcus nepalensis]AWI43553.1 purine nucleosidase [Staphylococcus nepalensis]MBO1205390.1 nucleoside hydrolase [Staphylococcus nepalensis]MCD8892099.1 nucleoside hydrolase [Staphylococcus nepalensis]